MTTYYLLFHENNKTQNIRVMKVTAVLTYFFPFKSSESKNVQQKIIVIESQIMSL